MSEKEKVKLVAKFGIRTAPDKVVPAGESFYAASDDAASLVAGGYADPAPAAPVQEDKPSEGPGKK